VKELRAKISKVREECAGCDIQSLEFVIAGLSDAISYAYENGFTYIARQLVRVKENLKTANTYHDRLDPDQKLCDIINRLDKVIG